MSDLFEAREFRQPEGRWYVTAAGSDETDDSQRFLSRDQALGITDILNGMAQVTPPDARALALAAASQCGEALSVLISFSREGESHPSPFGHEEPIEKLADALKMSIELAALCGETDSDRDQLLAALVRFLEGWAG